MSKDFTSANLRAMNDGVEGLCDVEEDRFETIRPVASSSSSRKLGIQERRGIRLLRLHEEC